MGHGWTHGMMSLDKKSKVGGKKDKDNPFNQWEVEKWQVRTKKE